MTDESESKKVIITRELHDAELDDKRLLDKDLCWLHK